MVIQMRESGYRAEFRPFGLDPMMLLRRDEDEESLAAERPRGEELPEDRRVAPGVLERLIGWVKRFGYAPRERKP